MTKTVLSMIISFAVCVAVMPIVMFLTKKAKAKQPILNYVDNHSHKSGTPTMGGIALIVSIVAGSLICMDGDASLMLMSLIVTVAFGIVGFLDDFIKIHFKENKGLAAWQKVVFQLAIAIIISLFLFGHDMVGKYIYTPFTFKEISLGYFAIPFYVFIFLAFTNSVNLTDGLDGLATGVTISYTMFFAAIIAVLVYYYGINAAYVTEYANLLIFSFSMIGALLGFMLFNGFPAQIFMGDTGSLALGGAVASLAVTSKLSLLAPIIGIMYVVTALSVIVQVLHYKRTKRRIFLMAPLHHHFERKGVHENRIVSIYSVITLFVGMVCLLIIMIVN